MELALERKSLADELVEVYMYVRAMMVEQCPSLKHYGAFHSNSGADEKNT